MQEMKSAWAAAAAAMFVWGCSGEDRADPIPVFDTHTAEYPGCSAYTPDPCDVATKTCQKDLFDLASCMWGSDEAEPPDTRVLTEREAVEYVVELADRLGQLPSERTYEVSQRALRLIDLQEAILTIDDVISIETVGAAAFYVFDDERIIIIDRDNLGEDGTTNAVLIHEYIHHLQQQDFRLGDEFGSGVPSDPLLAMQSVVEGGAFIYQAISEVMFEGVSPKRVSLDFDLLIDRVEEGVIEEQNPLLESGTLFPYIHGAHYMAQFWELDTQGADIRPYSSPPRATQNIMTDVDSAIDADPFTDEAPIPLEGSTLAFTDDMGAWFAYMFLARSGVERHIARRLALDVRRNEAWTFDDPAEDTVAFLWKMEWQSEATASEFESHVVETADPRWAITRSDTTTYLVASEATNSVESWRDVLLRTYVTVDTPAGERQIERFDFGARTAGLGVTCAFPTSLLAGPP